MGFESECDLAVEAVTAGDRDIVTSTRDDLLAEQLSVTAVEVMDAMAETDSVLDVVRKLGRATERALQGTADGRRGARHLARESTSWGKW